MPVAQSRGHAGKALVVASVSVVLLLGLAFLVAALASRGDVEVHLGDSQFDAGHLHNIAKAIAKEHGLPLLYQDLAGGNRNIFVQHLDANDDRGWVAFGAFDPDRPDCDVTIDRKAKVLVNACEADVTYPLDGTGLRYYPTSIDGDRLLVDINELSTTRTTAVGASSTTAG